MAYSEQFAKCFLAELLTVLLRDNFSNPDVSQKKFTISCEIVLYF